MGNELKTRKTIDFEDPMVKSIETDIRENSPELKFSGWVRRACRKYLEKKEVNAN